MKKQYHDTNDKRGKLLGSGVGAGSMMSKCKINGWTTENTILVVEGSGILSSKWYIYERING